MVHEMELQDAADFSDDNVLIGASHSVFVGKVVRVIGTQDRGFGPETQDEVAVVANIKGNLQGYITVNQEGGYENGVLYVIGGDGASDKYLLQQGSTYLFATRYNPLRNWYTIIAHPAGLKLITSDPSGRTADLAAVANADSRVQALRNAYPHEVLLEADIAHGNTLNSYDSLQQPVQ